MRDLTAAGFACLLLLPASVGVGKEKDPPANVSLPSERWNESRTVGLRTPAGWTVRLEPGPPEVLETRGDGMIVRYLYGVSILPKDLALALVEAKSGITGGSIRKLMDYCFSYDPAGRTYVFNLLRVSATVVIISTAC